MEFRAGTDPYNPSVTEALVGNRKVAAAPEARPAAPASGAALAREWASRAPPNRTSARSRPLPRGRVRRRHHATRENAIKANYAAQVQRIDQEMQALNSHANFVLGLASSDSQRQSAQLQYAAQANALLAQRQKLELQLQAELDRLRDFPTPLLGELDHEPSRPRRTLQGRLRTPQSLRQQEEGEGAGCLCETCWPE